MSIFRILCHVRSCRSCLNICNLGFDLVQVFFSALIDVAGHSKMLDEAFGILQEAKSQGIRLGTITYSSLMGACCNVCAPFIAVARALLMP